MKFTFKVGEKTKEAWPLYKKNFGSMLLMIAIIFIFQTLGHKNNISLSVFLIVFNLLLVYVWVRWLLGVIDKKDVNLFSKESLPDVHQFWDFIKTYILSMLCVLPFMIVSFLFLYLGHFVNPLIAPRSMLIFVAFVIFFFPFIYIIGRLFPSTYISIEKSQGARKNIREAWELTKGNGWRIVGKILLIALFIILGFFAFIVGSLITYPIGLILMVMMYRELQKIKMQTLDSPVNPTVPVDNVVSEVIPAKIN